MPVEAAELGLVTAGQKTKRRRNLTNEIVRNSALVVAILTMMGGVISFIVNEIDQKETRARESKSAFLQKQLGLYAEAVQVVEFISLYPNKVSDRDRYLANLQRFWELYYGELTMVEDVKVSDVMINIGKLLEPEGGTPRQECVGTKRDLSLMLAHCVRKSLGEGWGVDLHGNPDYCSDSAIGRLPVPCGSSPLDRS